MRLHGVKTRINKADQDLVGFVWSTVLKIDACVSFQVKIG